MGLKGKTSMPSLGMHEGKKSLGERGKIVHLHRDVRGPDSCRT